MRVFIPLFALLALANPGGAASPDARAIEFFEREVRPLLAGRCMPCHATATKARGGLKLDSRAGWQKGGASGPAIVPGNPAASLLIKAITYHDTALLMPPVGKLPANEIAVLEKWVRMGAPDPRTGVPTGQEGLDLARGRLHWAYRQPTRPPVPTVTDTAWPKTEIDRFIRARQEESGLTPVADADKRSLLRRATFDLIGLPPTPADAEAFVNDDASDAFEKVIDRLLASRHFGERWGRHWLDLARYADTSGAANNQFLIDAWRYRDYVISAFNQDKPYDRFILEQLAGDQLPATTPAQRDEQVIATGFLALGPYDAEKMTPQIRYDQIDEQIDVTTKTFLATTVSCARCHDHKYDPITTKEYYGLAGIFGSTEILKTAVYTKGKHTFVRMGVGAPIQGFRREPFDEFIQLQDHLYGGRQHVVRMGWDRNAELKAAKEAKTAKERAAHEAKAEAIQKKIDHLLTLSKMAEGKLKNYPVLPPTALGVCDSSKTGDVHVLIRGEPESKGPVAPRGLLAVATYGQAPVIPAKQSGRLELARWIASRDNPLTARVMVNRVWMHLLGQGLAFDVDNFGMTGERPTHPDLLDWLALDFIKDQWSVKRLIKRIMLSRVYQLATTSHKDAEEIDGDNRLLWRAHRKRLEAEPIRDAILAFSGQLDLEPRHRSLVAEHGLGTVRFDGEIITFDSPKRAIYLLQPRARRDELLTLFDMADPTVVVGQREETTVPSQALFLLNSPFIVGQAQAAAARLMREALPNDTARIDRAFQLALGRPATSADHAMARQFFAAYPQVLTTDEATKDKPGLEPSNTQPLTKAQRRQVLKREPAARSTLSSASSGEADVWTAFCQLLITSPEFRYLN